MLKAILFDLDNTLLDFSGFKRETALAAAKAMKTAGVQHDEKMIYKKIFEIYEKKGIEYQLTFGETLHELGVEQPALFERAKYPVVVVLRGKIRVVLVESRPAPVKSECANELWFGMSVAQRWVQQGR